MSMMKRSISIGFLVFACAAATTAYASGDPELVGVDATFTTKTNSNVDGTNFDIKVYNSQNVLVAEQTGITTTGHTDAWGDNSVDTVALDLKGAFKKSDLSAGKVRLDIHPDGKQKWEFNYNIDFTYADNSVVWQRWNNNKVLTQDKPTTSDSWPGQ